MAELLAIVSESIAALGGAASGRFLPIALAGAAIALAVVAATLGWRASAPRLPDASDAGRAPRPAGIGDGPSVGATAATPAWWRWHRRVCDAAPLRALARPSPAAARALDRRLAAAGLDTVLDAARWRAGVVVAAAWGAWTGLALAAVAGLARPESAKAAMLALGALSGALVGTALPVAWLRDRAQARREALSMQLPFQLDLVVLAIDAGMSLPAAIEQAVVHAPAGALREAWERTLSDLRAGRPRSVALQAFADRTDVAATRVLVAALIGALAQGAALGPLLRAQAEQRRHERFIAAETRAMRAPVRMLAPLALCVFPCTFIVLMFPLASRLIEEGWWR